MSKNYIVSKIIFGVPHTKCAQEMQSMLRESAKSEKNEDQCPELLAAPSSQSVKVEPCIVCCPLKTCPRMFHLVLESQDTQTLQFCFASHRELAPFSQTLLKVVCADSCPHPK